MDPVKAPLAAAFLRLFTVQASWNYERMPAWAWGRKSRCCAAGAPRQQGAYRAAVSGRSSSAPSVPLRAGVCRSPG
jgi:hypothetical protein